MIEENKLCYVITTNYITIQNNLYRESINVEYSTNETLPIQNFNYKKLLNFILSKD